MPIGKDSITKRVAKTDTVEKEQKSEVADTKTSETKTEVKKPSAKKTTVAKTTQTVISNIAPETLEAVIGHKEKQSSDKIEIGTDLPYYLL